MTESFGARYKRSRLAALISIVEPLAIIGMFTIIHSLRNVQPPYGSSTVLFYASGILPFYLFFHVSWTLRSWDRLRRLPRTTELDLLLSHSIDELLMKLIIISILYTGLYVYGVKEAIPVDPLQCLCALVVLVMSGIGAGFINAVIGAFFTAWTYMYAILMRAWMAFSGVLYVVDWLPPQLRDVVVQNPLSHAITWYRVGQYPNYPAFTLDREYAVVFAGIMLTLGIVTMNFTRPWRRTQ